MPFNSQRIQDIILPVGFVIIILLMISNAIITTSSIETNHKSIEAIQDEKDRVNDNLSLMSTSLYQRSLILFRMSMTEDPIRIDNLIDQLNEESSRFSDASEILRILNITHSKYELLSLQSSMAFENSSAITELIKSLQNRNFEKAQLILNERILPLMGQSLEVLKKIQVETKKASDSKVEHINHIAHDEESHILIFHLMSIILSFLLMLYLLHKQRQSNSDLSYLASTDKLTALSNRDTLIEQMDHDIANDPKSHFSIIFFDIDYFKSINDIYGHVVGDIVLQRFSNTIKKRISHKDILARFGGDEFVLYLKGSKRTNDIKNFVRNLSKELDTSFNIDNNEIYTSASIGISSYPSNGNDSKQLLKSADIAMYSAKEAGRNCYKFYSFKNSQEQEHKHKISHSLQTILNNQNSDKQLSLMYQPLVNIDDETFEDCEALIRWTDNNNNPVNTAEFIKIAEQSNLIQKVNMFVIDEACKQQHLWQKMGIKNVRIHINLSGNKRIFSELFHHFSENLNRYNLSPTLFGIELTERTIYETSEETNNSLENFRSMGMKISIDDFGTGYSSLSYLKELPITSVKIDRSFIKGIPDDKVDIALVKAIITLAHSLNFDVIAEGIETQEQFDFLKSCNCNIAQGYLLHRPLNPDAITQLKLVA